MFITCQKEMDFGEDHNAAMNVRLRKFHFKTLTSQPVAGAMKFLKEHAMDCIVWASSMAVTPVDELPPPVPETAQGDTTFDEEERERIRNFTMDDSDSDDAMVDEESKETPARNQESGEESEEMSDNADSSSYAKGWERSYEEISRLREQQPRNSLKRRQLELLGAGVKQFREDCDKRADLAREQFLEETKARWISLGMMKEEDADLLHSVDGPYHPNIEKSREEYFAKKKAEEERQLAEKARAYYQDGWVLGKEEELQDLQKQEEAATDPDTKRALQYIIEVAVDALKARFQREEVRGLQKYVLLERKRKAVQLRWCSEEQAEIISSIWCPLPFPSEVPQDEPSGRHPSQPRSQPSKSDDDDEDLFITQVASWEASHTQFERTRRVREDSQQGKKRSRPTDEVQPGISKRKATNTILNYFTSQ